MPLLAVNHHYFRDKGPGRGIYPISSIGIKKQLHTLNKCWDMVSEIELLSYCDSMLPTDDYICVFTFDDGLKEQMKAIGLLKEMEISAICYVPTAPIVDKVVLDVHKLQMVRSVQCDEELEKSLASRFNYSEYIFDDDLLSVQYRYDSIISRRIKYYLNFVLQKDARDEWVSILFEEKYGSEKQASEELYMGKNEIAYLAKHQMIGTHSHQHLPLATLSENEIKTEICNSMDILEDLSGQRVIGISYPYGGKSAVSPELFSIAEECGLKYGFTMERGINTSNEIKPFSLRRIDTNDVTEWCERR